MRIGSNLSALTAFNALTRSNNAINKTIQQLSTGLRINSAADDAAGLAISENFRAQSAGIERALRNSQDGISLIQTAEGALGETNSMLQRMRELAVQAANDTLTSQDRSYIQMEIDELKASIDRIANTTEFNGRSILDGSVCGTVTSTDPAVKGYIRGALETEGNFRIEVKADPGEAQVQKSSIMRVKHENVATNKNVNTDSGVGGVKIDGLPAGNYSVTATKIGGGQTITEYTSTTTIDVETENTSGVPEILRLSITGETTDGKSIYWPQNSSYSKTYKELTVP
ncbi:MAG: flagellin, partial [Synergistaceae bacterium]|nr:flagellin [Synergistaceae bacterium]